MRNSEKRAAEKYQKGARFSNKYGEWFSIIEYINCTNVSIKFDIDENPRWVKSKDINRSCLRPRNALTISGIACLGEGPYEAADNKGRPFRPYKLFRLMLDRCYTEAYRNRNRSYADCTVVPEWLNYQNFAHWYYKQPGHEVEDFQLDKDLTNSRVYGPEFCYFIPREINATLRTVAPKKNAELPRGVSISTGKLGYVSTYRESRNGSLTSFATIEEARDHYLMNTKRKLINVAKSYGDALHPNIVTLLENYDWESL